MFITDLGNQRCLVIIEIDSRSRKIVKDTNLTTLSMKNVDSLENIISKDLKTDVQVPFKQINGKTNLNKN